MEIGLIGNVTCTFQEGFSKPCLPASWQGASPANLNHISPQNLGLDFDLEYKSEAKVGSPQAEDRCSGNTSGVCNIESPALDLKSY